MFSSTRQGAASRIDVSSLKWIVRTCPIIPDEICSRYSYDKNQSSKTEKRDWCVIWEIRYKIVDCLRKREGLGYHYETPRKKRGSETEEFGEGVWWWCWLVPKGGFNISPQLPAEVRSARVSHLTSYNLQHAYHSFTLPFLRQEEKGAFMNVHHISNCLPIGNSGLLSSSCHVWTCKSGKFRLRSCYGVSSQLANNWMNTLKPFSSLSTPIHEGSFNLTRPGACCLIHSICDNQWWSREVTKARQGLNHEFNTHMGGLKSSACLNNASISLYPSHYSVGRIRVLRPLQMRF